MRRRALFAGVAAVAFGAAVWAAAGGGRGAARFAADAAVVPRTEQPLFTPSDVARLAATGRPQLVEFYHPG